MTCPVQVKGEVLSVRRVGAYHHLTIIADGIAEPPGRATSWPSRSAGPASAMLLRRAFSIYAVSPRGVYGGTVEFVFAVHGAGTRWLADRQRGDPIDVVGPLGRPFPLPREPRPGRAGRRRLRHRAAVHARRGAARPRAAGSTWSLGAATEDRLFGALEAKRMSATMAVTTDDGSAGAGPGLRRAAALLERSGTDVVYACGPDGDAPGGRRDRRGARHPQSGRGRGVDGLRHRRLHDLRAAGRSATTA